MPRRKDEDDLFDDYEDDDEYDKDEIEYDEDDVRIAMETLIKKFTIGKSIH